jgi:hypothetical protein
MRAGELAVVSMRDDLHAHAVRQALKDRHAIHCHMVASDCLADTGGLSWEPASSAGRAPTLPTIDGGVIDVRRLEVLWWRRINGEPQIPKYVTDPVARDLIANDCRGTLLGILDSAFRGRWISHYEATRRAETKLVQLSAAVAAGLRTPRTLVSQDPERIRAFCAALDHRVVVKTVAGTRKAGLAVGRVSPEMLASDAALRLSPAIYQEVIEGDRHLRVHAFGDEFHSALITTPDVDWRMHLDRVRVEYHALPHELERRLSALLADLGLRAGVFDLKLDADGEPVWFEVNPQGQFLFIEGLGGLALTNAYADFLRAELDRAQSLDGRAVA